MNEATLPRQSFPPIRSLSGLFRTGFPRAILLMGDRTNSSREEHLVLEFSVNILAIDDVVIESKMAGDSDSERFNNLGASSTLTWA